MTFRPPTSVDSLVDAAMRLPYGADYYRCAFQVNPYGYLQRYKKKTAFLTEKEYNDAIAASCKSEGIDVIAVTDHFRIKDSVGLISAVESAGVKVFPGFEAATSEGVHFLCLFNPGTPIGLIERAIGACRVHDPDIASPLSELRVEDLLSAMDKCGAICISAHSTLANGLLTSLHKQARAKAWRAENLLAIAIPGPVSDLPQDFRPIVENRNPDYQRDYPVAVLNACDVSSPEDLAIPAASCWLKMSTVSISGLRQAFMDPGSRIRLHTDERPLERAELLAITWEGGFLDGMAIRFNSNLNVLVGGRGTGKSTIIESIRYALDLQPIGDEARQSFDGIKKNVLKSGTRLTLALRSHQPSPALYRIERTVPNPPVVLRGDGTLTSLTPRDVLGGVEVLGQHEIAEMARSAEKLTFLLTRFVPREPALSERKRLLRLDLERNRTRFLEAWKQKKAFEERMAKQPALQETLKRYQDLGIEERLKEQSEIVREEQIQNTASERVAYLKERVVGLRDALPLDVAFLAPQAIQDLPGQGFLVQVSTSLDRLGTDVDALCGQLEQRITAAEGQLLVILQQWGTRKAQVGAAYEKALREMQRTNPKVDGAEFIRVKREMEALKPLQEKRAEVEKLIVQLVEQRNNLVHEWEDLKGTELRMLREAAQKVTKKLRGRLRVEVRPVANVAPLEEMLREALDGRIAETVIALQGKDDLSLSSLSSCIKEGPDALVRDYGLTRGQAEKLSKIDVEDRMRLVELELPPATELELNVAYGTSDVPDYRCLDDLSKGQKATAILLLLLLESEAPLVVDQPEDDLDNRFIAEDIVHQMRAEKRRRQFIFATHNANIPVLGDSELIVGLQATGEAGGGHAEIRDGHRGSIDEDSVRDLVEDVLEGGKTAFETRRRKYGF